MPRRIGDDQVSPVTAVTELIDASPATSRRAADGGDRRTNRKRDAAADSALDSGEDTSRGPDGVAVGLETEIGTLGPQTPTDRDRRHEPRVEVGAGENFEARLLQLRA